mgnify:CR=1 FL=1
MDRRQILMEEFKEAGQLHRLHIGLLFGHLVIFLGIIGALLSKYIELSTCSFFYKIFCAFAGAFLTLLFIILHERVFEYSIMARNRAEKIQEMLDLDLYKTPKNRFFLVRFFSVYISTRYFFISILILWLSLGFWTIYIKFF